MLMCLLVSDAMQAREDAHNTDALPVVDKTQSSFNFTSVAVSFVLSLP